MEGYFSDDAGTDGISQTYDGYLVGADRSKDLAVLKINAPKVNLGACTNLL